PSTPTLLPRSGGEERKYRCRIALPVLPCLVTIHLYYEVFPLGVSPMEQRGRVGWWASWLAAAGVVLVLLGAWAGCTPVRPVWPEGPERRVVLSFPPLYSFAKNVAGDDAHVLCLLTTHGPHDYPYDPKDLIPLRTADLFLVNGLGLDEDFSEKLKNNCGN